MGRIGMYGKKQECKVLECKVYTDQVTFNQDFSPILPIELEGAKPGARQMRKPSCRK